ncbi:MAG: hypothetical protein J7641_18430 [Cyanobacteria bacterium SID2]|nr:hypothetical protein [Cyanobacteria bacterium SID2]MBP0002658.1 hypothetical protein [Cyanobacteria bacterium SBC]
MKQLYANREFDGVPNPGVQPTAIEIFTPKTTKERYFGVLLELRCNLVAYDTNIVVGANGRSPRRQEFWSLINSAYHSNTISR